MERDVAGRVFVSGIFNVLHPGHIRLLRFAKSLGSELVVGVLSDGLAGSAATMPEEQRLEAVENLRAVSASFIIHDSVEDAIKRLRPDIVVKGREHRTMVNPEEAVLRECGGRIVFSSGDSFFSVRDLVVGDRPHEGMQRLALPDAFMEHQGITRRRLGEIVQRMQSVNTLVVGDVIVDEYISCHPLGMSREDPTLVVAPVETQRFNGGAAIVAGHAGSLGQSASLHSVTGDDEQGVFVRQKLEQWGVKHFIVEDSGRPTTTKQRFRAGGKTLLRVSRLMQDSIPDVLQERILESVTSELGHRDLIIFSDFNYGVLPQPLVAEISRLARKAGLTLAADSQTSSQIGDISRFEGMDLLTPTEYEARVASRNFEDGLVILADNLRKKANAQAVLMTLAEDGVFIRGSAQDTPPITDRVPALNPNPVDVAGAGDSLLVVSSMALACGATIREAGLLGSIAAAIQVSVTGNRPLAPETLYEAIDA